MIDRARYWWQHFDPQVITGDPWLLAASTCWLIALSAGLRRSRDHPAGAWRVALLLGLANGLVFGLLYPEAPPHRPGPSETGPLEIGGWIDALWIGTAVSILSWPFAALLSRPSDVGPNRR